MGFPGKAWDIALRRFVQIARVRIAKCKSAGPACAQLFTGVCGFRMTEYRPPRILLLGMHPLFPGECRHAAMPLALRVVDRRRGPPGRAAVPDKYLLDDTDGIIFLNVRQLAGSPLFKKHYLDLVQKTLQGSEVAQREFKAIGLDPLKDIDRLLVVHAESSHRLDPKPGGKAESGLYFILRGKFDTDKIQERAAQDRQGFAQAAQNSQDCRRHPLRIRPGAAALRGYAGRDRAVISPFREQVMEALAKAGKRKLQLKSKAMQAMIDNADVKQCLWLAGVGSMVYDFNTTVVVVKGKKVAKTTKETMASAGVASISGGVIVGEGIKTEIVVSCPTEKTAKQTAQYIQEDVNQGVQRAFQASLAQKQFDPLREYLRRAWRRWQPARP